MSSDTTVCTPEEVSLSGIDGVYCLSRTESVGLTVRPPHNRDDIILMQSQVVTITGFLSLAAVSVMFALIIVSSFPTIPCSELNFDREMLSATHIMLIRRNRDGNWLGHRWTYSWSVPKPTFVARRDLTPLADVVVHRRLFPSTSSDDGSQMD
jgi:hypothetical protein